MAGASLKVCNAPGCRAISDQAKCEKHRVSVIRSKKQADPFYSSSQWRKLKARHKANNPLCVMCLKEGRTKAVEDVNHIKPRRDYPELELDPSNLESLCKSHHSRITHAGK